MSDYLAGLLTIPAVLLGAWLAVAVASVTTRLLGMLTLGTLHWLRPDDSEGTYRRRAEVMYSLKRGAMFSKGDFVLLLGHGIDHDRHGEARKRLLRRLSPVDLRVPEEEKR